MLGLLLIQLPQVAIVQRDKVANSIRGSGHRHLHLGTKKASAAGAPEAFF